VGHLHALWSPLEEFNPELAAIVRAYGFANPKVPVSRRIQMHRGYFSVGDKRVTTEEILGAEPPEHSSVEALTQRFTRNIRSGETPPEALTECLSGVSHPWLLAIIAVAFKSLEWRAKNKTDKNIDEDAAEETPGMALLEELEWANPMPAQLHELAAEFVIKTVRELSRNFFHLGENWVSYDSVCSASPPSNEERVACWWTLGTCIAVGVPILESLKIAAGATSHPWLIMLLAVGEQQIRDGEGLASGILSGMHEFQYARIRSILELGEPEKPTPTRNVEAVPPSPEADSGEQPPSARYTTRRVDRTTFGRRDPLGAYYVPNFRGAFELDLHMIDVGEETGALDETLMSLVKLYNSDGSDRSPRQWSTAVQQFLSALAHLQKAGLPILRSLRILENSALHYQLHSELGAVIEEIETGCTLSEAVEKVGKELSTPLLIAALRAGEAGGALDVVLTRLSS
jgi:hypothetical protein